VSGPPTVRVAWPAEGMMLLTTRPSADTAWWDARLARKDSALDRRELMSFVDRVDPQASSWAAGGPQGGWAAPLLGAGNADGIYASLRVADEVVIHLGLHHPTAADAAKTAATLNQELDPYLSEPIMAGFLAGAAFVVEGTDAVFTLSLDALRVLAILRTMGSMLEE
jgi:hypothetical protein